MYPGQSTFKPEFHHTGFVSDQQTPTFNSPQQPSRNSSIATPPVPNELQTSQYCRELSIPHCVIGCVIGKGGSGINEIRKVSQATIIISACDGDNEYRRIVITGNWNSVNIAEALIHRSIDLHMHKLAMNIAMNTLLSSKNKFRNERSQYPLYRGSDQIMDSRENYSELNMKPTYGGGIQFYHHEYQNASSSNAPRQRETTLHYMKECSEYPWNVGVSNPQIPTESRTPSMLHTSQMDTQSLSSNSSRPIGHVCVMSGQDLNAQNVSMLFQNLQLNSRQNHH